MPLGFVSPMLKKAHCLPLQLNLPALKDVDAQAHNEQQKLKYYRQGQKQQIFTYAVTQHFIEEPITAHIKLGVLKGCF